jgi:hypothetical protein
MEEEKTIQQLIDSLALKKQAYTQLTKQANTRDNGT